MRAFRPGSLASPGRMVPRRRSSIASPCPVDASAGSISIAMPATPSRATAPAGRHRPDDAAGSVPASCRLRSHDTPATGSSHASGTDAPRPPAGQRASPFPEATSCSGAVVQHRLRQQHLQLGVLVLQCLQPSRRRHVQPVRPGLPHAEGDIRDAVAAADIRRFRTGLLLPQDPGDLVPALTRPSATVARIPRTVMSASSVS